MRVFYSHPPLQIVCFLLPALLAGCAAVDPLRHAPPSASQRSSDPRQASLARTLENEGRATAVPAPNEELRLPRLVDLAQQNNRTTRLAWQQARAAAFSAGIAAADYFPLLAVAASYGGGYLDFQTSARNNIGGALMAASLVPASMGSAVDQITGSGTVVRSGWGTAYTNALAGAGLRWLLFDFGARDHRNRAALSEQLAANMRFNAAHQKVVFAVTEAYYHLQASRRREAAARISQESAADVLKAAEARFAQGLLTEPELAEVRAAHAQADFDLVTARSQVEVARVDLATAAGLPPGLPFRTPDADFSRLTAALDQPLDSHIRTALRQRPDLLAQVSAVQAAEARLREARAARLPTLALDAVAQYNRFSPTGNNSDAFTDISETFTNTGGFLTVQWPLFAGFAKDNAERLAETAREAAREELHLLREKTIAEVWKSYVRAKNAVAGRQAATALESAATDSYQATLAGFDRGITPIQEVLKARAARAQAAALSANADAAIAESLTTLALSSGSL